MSFRSAVRTLRSVIRPAGFDAGALVSSLAFKLATMMAYRHLRNIFKTRKESLCLRLGEFGQGVRADAIPTPGYDADANDKPTKYIPESHIPAGSSEVSHGGGVLP